MFRLRSCLVSSAVTLTLALAGCSNSAPPPVSVSLTPSTTQAIDQGASFGVSIKATVTNDVNSKGVTWTLSGPGTLSSTTSSTTYTQPTTPLLTSPQQVTVTATSLADSTKSASIQITVNPNPAIPNQNLPTGTAGATYSQPITMTGGTGPFSWTIYNGAILTGSSVGGTLPSGLTLNPTTGMITGTPTSAGTWYFEVALIDADNLTAVNGFLTLQINPAATTAGNAVPFLNQPLIPTAVTPGSGAFTLNVSGTNFISSSTINFNSTRLTTTFIDKQHLSAMVPAADIATAGTASITVVNPSPGGGASNVAFLPIGAAHSSVRFANALNSPLQISEPAGLAVADFNQDGKPDLAIAANIKLYTMLSNGNGTFTSASGSPLSLPSPPYDDEATPYVGSLAVGDFNHSGNLGLAVSLINNNAAAILLGIGNGNFSPSSAAFANTQGQSTEAVASADFNADGNLDLAFANSALGVSPVDLGYGLGSFNTAGSLYSTGGGFPQSIAVGDFNRDGKLDVAMANGGSSVYPFAGVSISLGNGDGTFAQPTGSPMLFGQNLSGIVAADFNGDGKLDLAVTDAAANTVSILLGNGDGTFQAPVAIATGNGPLFIITADFNNDGNLDLAISNVTDGTVTLLLGNGNGTFTPASGSPYTVGKGPDYLVAADFNGDGKLDLAVSNGADGTGTVSILLQQ